MTFCKQDNDSFMGNAMVALLHYCGSKVTLLQSYINYFL